MEQIGFTFKGPEIHDDVDPAEMPGGQREESAGDVVCVIIPTLATSCGAAARAIGRNRVARSPVFKDL
jgi:hypothetical protein